MLDDHLGSIDVADADLTSENLDEDDAKIVFSSSGGAGAAFPNDDVKTVSFDDGDLGLGPWYWDEAAKCVKPVHG